MATSLNSDPPPDVQAGTVNLSCSMAESGFDNNNRSGRHRLYEMTGRMMMKTRLMLLGMLESQRRTRTRDTALQQKQMSM